MNSKYYSADNGFACAAAGRGITEALQEHLNVIVRDESLATEMSRSQIQGEINDLVEDKERLEQQKLDRQDSIRDLTRELAEKNVKLSELNAELEAPVNADMSPLEDDRIEALKDKIEGATAELEGKQVELAAIETDLEKPTKIELNDGAIQTSSKQRFSWLQLTFAIFTTLALIGLIIYIFIFYASVAEKAFIKASDLSIIDHDALFDAWKEKNLFVLLLPVVFVFFSIATYLYYEQKNWKMFWIVVFFIVLFDISIALRIAISIDIFIKNKEFDAVPKLLWWLNLFGVIFLGFVVSLLLSAGFHCFMELWRRVVPRRDETEQEEKQIRAEKNDRLVRQNTLAAEIQHLENRIGDLKQEKETYQKHLEQTYEQQRDARLADHKHPIEVEIARMNTKKENLQNQISEHNEQVESIQREINKCESEIEAKLKSQSKRVIDVKKLESQANEFVSGWCRYVAQRKTELSDDVSTQIRHIQHYANETLEAFKASLAEI